MKQKLNVIAKVKDKGKIKHIKYKGVTNLHKMVRYFDKTFDAWYYFNIYDSRTKERLSRDGQYTKNNFY